MESEEINKLNAKCHQMTIEEPDEEGVVIEVGDLEGAIDVRWSLVAEGNVPRKFHESIRASMRRSQISMGSQWLRDLPPRARASGSMG
ncbi:hypothetical protein K2173_017706 [Erythroxylum novogranatense]|uniref:Uncharacterized protein n=1 Tax=Erythroxylum novogranatense TaxID=1862640 RepID=A0AAV8SM65_9ROSI|nr:hypothetical protein K2173_017706 [Erythroxylum novogranatense]